MLAIELGTFSLGYPVFLLAWGGGDRLRGFLSLLSKRGMRGTAG
jgi:hypothetical protein